MLRPHEHPPRLCFEVSPRIKRLLIVLTGIFLGQAILYGPSLFGNKILLPLDLLSLPGTYLPNTYPVTEKGQENSLLSDPILFFEPARRFAAAEAHAGRIPMWATYHYAGAPFIWPKFSPLLAPGMLTESPRILSWCQMLAAVVAGVGAYLFFRVAIRISFCPAAICAWCYPLTGFFILWQGFPIGMAVYWLPWILLAVYKAVNDGPLALVALAVITGAVVLSGHLDVAGQVLMGSGLYAIWCLAGNFSVRAVAKLSAGWLLGLLLAAPFFLPVLEYTRTSPRLTGRASGREERPPVGWRALPQVVLPDIYGTTARFDWGELDSPTARLLRGNQLESSGTAYAGILAALVVAPLGFAARRNRKLNWFWAFLALFALSWSLNLPGLVQVLRLPGLNMMSHNRMAFLAAFCILAVAASGLDLLLRHRIEWRNWFWFPAGLLAALAILCFYRSLSLPEPLDSQFTELVVNGGSYGWIKDLDAVHRVQGQFSRFCFSSAAWCALGVSVWLCLRFRPEWQRRVFWATGTLLVADLLYFAYARNLQSEPELYFPTVPALQQVAQAHPTRIVGYGCLFASLAEMCGLHDVRGYDSVDPGKYLELVGLAFGTGAAVWNYAGTAAAVPRVTLTENGDIRLSPVLDMLGVQYVIFRGEPPTNAQPVFQSPDYWVLKNPSALPHVFIPRRVETITNSATRLEKLAARDFDPRDAAYVESSVGFAEPCQGEAEIVEEIPTRIRISLRMATPGLVVLSDLWDKGWRAYLNKMPVPILRTNHALRGVVVPSGAGHLEFRYEPESFALGIKLALFAAVVLVGWTGFTFWGSHRRI